MRRKESSGKQWVNYSRKGYDMNIIQALQEKEDLLHGDELDEKTIEAAEAELHLRFAPDYRKYLHEMTIAAYDGHELTGLSKADRTNVVSVTKQKWLECPKVPHEWYVVEDAGIDWIVVWQSQDGKVYETVGDEEPMCVAETMVEFVLK